MANPTRRVVVDADTSRGVGSAFALVYAFAYDRLSLEAVYAPPGTSNAPALDMRRSAETSTRILADIGITNMPVLYGARRFFDGVAEHSDALFDLAVRAKKPLSVLCFGATTNVANAITLYPEIAEHITVVNVDRPSFDAESDRALLNSKVSVINVASRLTTTKNALIERLRGDAPAYTALKRILEKHIDTSVELFELAVPALFLPDKREGDAIIDSFFSALLSFCEDDRR